MEVLVVRHAVAAEHGTVDPDEARPLTDAGRAKFRREVRGLERLGLRVDRCYYSPWTRAAETADLMRRLVDGEMIVEPLLTAPPTPELVHALAGKRAALVGHEPWMSQLVALLILGKTDEAESFIFKKGGVAWLEGEPNPGGMRLRALLPPAVLRKI